MAKFFFKSLRNLFYTRGNNDTLTAEVVINDRLICGVIVTKENYILTVTFIKRGTDQTFSLQLEQDFSISMPFDTNLYSRFRDFFEIYSGNIKNFKLKSFLIKLDNDIQYKSIRNMNRQSVARALNLEDSDRGYFDSLINWDLNPQSGYHVTPENRRKVRILLPELYEQIGDRNISVRFTSIPRDNQTERIAIDEYI